MANGSCTSGVYFLGFGRASLLACWGASGRLCDQSPNTSQCAKKPEGCPKAPTYKKASPLQKMLQNIAITLLVSYCLTLDVASTKRLPKNVNFFNFIAKIKTI